MSIGLTGVMISEEKLLWKNRKRSEKERKRTTVEEERKNTEHRVKVISLEKELAQLRKKLKDDQRMVQKRNIDETEWLNDEEQKHSYFPNSWPPQQQRVVNYVDRNNTLLEGGGAAGHIYGHSVYSSVLHGLVV
ncbi:hypothetical protein HAX54_041005 [Datura stramonium]|uniref:Uncharacterized protein n=1 Tax=Datura stramonium TaxID=4076 RepID=A0ABS8VSB2_DATST|nr:hypothetical protein [Datura stramonium]